MPQSYRGPFFDSLCNFIVHDIVENMMRLAGMKQILILFLITWQLMRSKWSDSKQCVIIERGACVCVWLGKLTMNKSRFQEEFPELAAGADDKTHPTQKKEDESRESQHGPSLRPQSEWNLLLISDWLLIIVYLAWAKSKTSEWVSCLIDYWLFIDNWLPRPSVHGHGPSL